MRRGGSTPPRTVMTCATPAPSPLARRARRLLAALLGAAALAAQAAPAPAQPTRPGEPPRFTLPAGPSVPPAPSLHEADALRVSQAAIGRQLGEHALLDRQGRPVRLSSYRGKPLLVSFIYTGCFQVCPTTTRSLRDAIDPLIAAFGADSFQVVSIGFNQPADSPTAMRAFAAQHGVNRANWDFLSPPPAAVDALLRDFGFSYLATPSGFDHVVGVTVVDADGRVYAHVYGEQTRADQLGEPLRQLLRAGPMPDRGALSSLVERVRILCTVYDPDSGQYRFKYALLLEIIGGLLFAGAVLVFFALEWRERRRRVRAAAAAPRQPVTLPSPRGG